MSRDSDPTWGCLFGDTSADMREHHPTGSRWDPEIILPLCHDHHMLVHDDWQRAGVGPEVEPPTMLHVLAMTLHRWGMLIGRLAHEGRVPNLLIPLADWLTAKAEQIQRFIDGLDRGLGPTWRALPEFVVGEGQDAKD